MDFDDVHNSKVDVAKGDFVAIEGMSTDEDREMSKDVADALEDEDGRAKGENVAPRWQLKAKGLL